MRLATFTESGVTRLGVVLDDGLVDLAAAAPELPREMTALLAAGERRPCARARPPRRERARASRSTPSTLAPPILRPPKFLAIGLNYADHVAESGARGAEVPHRLQQAVDLRHRPARARSTCRASRRSLDYEGELGFVIGRRCRHVPRARAHEVIAGYLVVQRRDACATGSSASPTWTMGKSFDTHGPIGPWLTTADEVGDPHGLRAAHLGERRAAPGLEHEAAHLRLLRAGRAPLDGLHARARRRHRDRHAGRRRHRDASRRGSSRAGDVRARRDRRARRAREPGGRRAATPRSCREAAGDRHAPPPPRFASRSACPTPRRCARFYRDFGLAETAPGRFETADGGEQLRIEAAPRRRAARARDRRRRRRRPRARRRRAREARRRRRARASARSTRVEPASGVRVRLAVEPRLEQKPAPALALNAPGRTRARDARSPAVLAGAASRPRKLCARRDRLARRRRVAALLRRGHRLHVSDEVPAIGASFLRCSTDHHNLLVQPRARSRSCTTPRGRWTTSTRSAARAAAMVGGRPGAPRLGPRPPRHRLELLLVPARPGRQLRRVLERPRRDRRRRGLEGRGVGAARTRSRRGARRCRRRVPRARRRDGARARARRERRTSGRDGVDVAIVGYGPVGQTLAILLGQRGWRVGVFESWPEPIRCRAPCTSTTRSRASCRARASPTRSRPHRAGADATSGATPPARRCSASAATRARASRAGPSRTCSPARARAHARRARARAARACRSSAATR